MKYCDFVSYLHDNELKYISRIIQQKLCCKTIVDNENY